MSSKRDIIQTNWNTIFLEYLDKLNELFPESPASRVKLQYTLGKYISDPISIYVNSLLDHEQEVISQNEEYFFGNENNIQFVKNLELKKYYYLSSEHNRKIIWTYIVSLYLLGKEFINLNSIQQ